MGEIIGWLLEVLPGWMVLLVFVGVCVLAIGVTATAVERVLNAFWDPVLHAHEVEPAWVPAYLDAGWSSPGAIEVALRRQPGAAGLLPTLYDGVERHRATGSGAVLYHLGWQLFGFGGKPPFVYARAGDITANLGDRPVARVELYAVWLPAVGSACQHVPGLVAAEAAAERLRAVGHDALAQAVLDGAAKLAAERPGTAALAAVHDRPEGTP